MTGRITKSENVVWRRVNDDVIVIPQNGQQICVLNKTAAIVWDMLDGDCEVDKIPSHLSERFEVSYETACNDVTGIIETFIRNGLVNQI